MPMSTEKDAQNIKVIDKFIIVILWGLFWALGSWFLLLVFSDMQTDNLDELSILSDDVEDKSLIVIDYLQEHSEVTEYSWLSWIESHQSDITVVYPGSETWWIVSSLENTLDNNTLDNNTLDNIMALSLSKSLICDRDCWQAWDPKQVAFIEQALQNKQDDLQAVLTIEDANHGLLQSIRLQNDIPGALYAVKPLISLSDWQEQRKVYQIAWLLLCLILMGVTYRFLRNPSFLVLSDVSSDVIDDYNDETEGIKSNDKKQKIPFVLINLTNDNACSLHWFQQLSCLGFNVEIIDCPLSEYTDKKIDNKILEYNWAAVLLPAQNLEERFVSENKPMLEQVTNYFGVNYGDFEKEFNHLSFCPQLLKYSATLADIKNTLLKLDENIISLLDFTYSAAKLSMCYDFSYISLSESLIERLKEAFYDLDARKVQALLKHLQHRGGDYKLLSDYLGQLYEDGKIAEGLAVLEDLDYE